MSEGRALGIMKNLGRLFPQIDKNFDEDFISDSIGKLKCPINRDVMKDSLDWRETFAQLNWTEGLEIMTTNVTCVFSGALWLKRHQENPNYGAEEDYRYFRSNDSGFQGALKPVYSHDLGGCIMNAVRVMGMSPNEAVQREVKNLRSGIQDYVGLRDEVLTCFKEAFPLVDTCDKMLEGGLRVLANSEWYEVSRKMEIMDL